jgi:hypothetical protein
VTSTDMPISSAQAATIGNTGTTRWFALGTVVGPILFGLLGRPGLSKPRLHFVGYPDRTVFADQPTRKRSRPWPDCTIHEHGFRVVQNPATRWCRRHLPEHPGDESACTLELHSDARALTHWPSLVWHLYPGVDVPSFRGFLARPRKPVAEFPGRRVVASPHPALARVWEPTAFRQSVDASSRKFSSSYSSRPSIRLPLEPGSE